MASKNSNKNRNRKQEKRGSSLAFNQSRYEQIHRRNLQLYELQIEELYRQAGVELTWAILQARPKTDAALGKAEWALLNRHIDRIIGKFRKGLYTAIVNGINAEWTLSNNKNSELARAVFGDNVGRLSQEQYRRYFSTNGDARDAFVARQISGLNLSQRVWNLANQFKAEMELVTEVGIRNGIAAEEMQRELKQYLNEPDNWFRRFRYKVGEDEQGMPIYGKKWKKRYFDEATGKYKWQDVDLATLHPGRGVYLSSRKNARRMAVTETNIAYRTADYLRYQEFDFVVGIRIEVSNTNHLVPDICDLLAGDYPKTFKWTGWHPHCRCHALSILKTMEEMAADTKSIINGGQPSETSVNTVTDLPANYTDWLEQNKDKLSRLRAMGKLPYFVRDNE